MATIRDPSARQRIVAVAAAVVADAGVRGATIRAIAAAADVTTGYITHYFADKQALITEVIRYTNATAERRVRDAIAAAGGGLAGLEAATEVMLPLDAARMQEWRIWIAVWGQESDRDEFGAGYRTGWNGLRTIFVELLEQAIRDRDLRDGTDTDFESERLVTMLAGAGLLAGVQAPARARRLATRMLREQIRGLAGTPA